MGWMLPGRCYRDLFREEWSQAYDQHLNIVLGEVEETVTTTEIDNETFEEIVKTERR